MIRRGLWNECWDAASRFVDRDPTWAGMDRSDRYDLKYKLAVFVRRAVEADRRRAKRATPTAETGGER